MGNTFGCDWHIDNQTECNIELLDSESDSDNLNGRMWEAFEWPKLAPPTFSRKIPLGGVP
jgi:hypothetical protein